MIKQAIIRLKWSAINHLQKSFPNPPMLRKAVAKNFPENNLFHQHDKNGKLMYRYPRIHYRWDSPKRKYENNYIGDGIIAAFNEGVDAVAKLFTSDVDIEIEESGLQTSEITYELRKCELLLTDELHEYFFRSPWLPLNREKYQHFHTKPQHIQQKELNRISRGNILTAARDLGIEFDNTVYTLFQEKKRVACPYKDIKLQGFTGKLITNIDLPDDFAIGAKVSHGYGWIKKII